ncbi:MAG: cupin-like domain-containing protein [Pseudomonadota bacterium]
MTQPPVFADADRLAMADAFPNRPVKVRHSLSGDRRLALPQLIELAGRLPANPCHEYSASDIHKSQPDEEKIPGTGLSFVDTIRTMGERQSWAAIRSFQHDPEYKALLDHCIEESGIAEAIPSGRTYMHDGFFFITSPNGVTPFHVDPEYNILLQIEGRKSFYVFPANDPEIMSERDQEDFYVDGKKNLAFDDARFPEKGQRFDLGPGDALFVPVKMPHWVQNGSEISISLSVTWRSEETDRERRIFLSNRRLRGVGAPASLLARSDISDRVKALAGRLIDRLS